MIKKYLKLLQQQLQTPELRRVPWEVLGLPVFLGVVYLIAFFMSFFLLNTLLEDRPEPTIMLGTSLLSGLLLIGFTFQYTGVSIRQAREDKRIKGDVRLTEWLALDAPMEIPLWGMAMVGFSLAVLVDTIGLVLGVPPLSLPIPLADISEDELSLFSLAAFTLLIVRPLAAELIFRGVWYPALVKQMPPLYAVGVSSLVFAILQYLTDPQYLWWGFFTPLAIGICTGIARAASKSTQTALVIHMMFSLFIILRAILN